MHNAKRWLEWCKARSHWTLEEWKLFLWSDESRFTIRRTNLDCGYLPQFIVTTVKFNGGGIICLGLFFMVRARPLSSVVEKYPNLSKSKDTVIENDSSKSESPSKILLEK